MLWFAGARAAGRDSAALGAKRINENHSEVPRARRRPRRRRSPAQSREPARASQTLNSDLVPLQPPVPPARTPPRGSVTGRPSRGSAFHFWPNQNLSRVTRGESSLTALAFRNRTWRTWLCWAWRPRPVTGFEKAKTNGFHRRQNTPFWWSPASCLLSPSPPPPTKTPGAAKRLWS